MVEKAIMVVNPSGIHARPASLVVDYVKKYPGTAEVIKDGKTGSLKSILTVLTMGLKKGTEITVRVSGEKEEEFLESLCEFILNLKD